MNPQTAGSTAGGGFDNMTVIPMCDVFDLLDSDLKTKVRDCNLSDDKLRLGDVIGAGSFGVVYKGQLSQDQCDVVVAVKTLRGAHLLHTYNRKQFLVEISRM